MNIVDFFNPQDETHQLALAYFAETRQWPKGFLPPNVEQPENWETQLLDKMVSIWTEEYLKKIPVKQVH